MALDADVFADLAESYIQEEMESAFPDIIKSVSVSETPRDDGSIETVVTQNHGPPEIDREKIRPVFRAIGRAIVEVLTENAEVSGGKIS
jgi:hypothetical protein